MLTLNLRKHVKNPIYWSFKNPIDKVKGTIFMFFFLTYTLRVHVSIYLTKNINYFDMYEKLTKL